MFVSYVPFQEYLVLQALKGFVLFIIIIIIIIIFIIILYFSVNMNKRTLCIIDSKSVNPSSEITQSKFGILLRGKEWLKECVIPPPLQ